MLQKRVVPEKSRTRLEIRGLDQVRERMQDGDELRSIYKDTYVYNTGKKAVKDPVFGEYHGSQQAVDKAKALEMKGPK